MTTLLLLKDDARGRSLPTTDDRPGARRGRRSIRCPKCAWQPKRSDLWMCICLHVWNTFETGGVCPQCAKRWTDTQCLSCRAWSPHADWYVDDPAEES